MAKKKMAETANIKAGPILRAQGEDPSKTKSYCVRDDWKDISKVNYVAFKSVNGEVQDLTVNGEPAGGGGFASVAINVVNSSQNDVQIYMPLVSPGSNKVVPEWFFDAGSDNDYQVIAPSIGYIDTVTQQIQIASVTGTGNVTVTTVSAGVYQVNINGAGSINIA